MENFGGGGGGGAMPSSASSAATASAPVQFGNNQLGDYGGSSKNAPLYILGGLLFLIVGIGGFFLFRKG